MNCNQCEMLSINGLACHEIGCPETRTWKCRECDEVYPRTVDVCLCMEPCNHNPGKLNEDGTADCVACGEIVEAI
jgi:hypothetical protein